MPLVGTFDPNGYIAKDPTTYPPSPYLPKNMYRAGDWWELDPAGTFNGTPTAVGDTIAPAGPPGMTAWLPADTITFLLLAAATPPIIRPPIPYAGCPLGDRFPGWRFIIDAYTNIDDGSRVYGSLTYGAELYGDANNLGVLGWVDVTEPHYSTTITRGTEHGDYITDVDQITVEAIDTPGTWYSSTGAHLWGLAVGDRLRVGVTDPNGKYYPLAVGEIERVTDEHDRSPRELTVEAFGNQMDLVTTLTDWSPPRETFRDRLDRILTASDWRWGTPILPAHDPDLLGLADPDPITVEAREELDLTAISAGLTVDTDTRGILRVREWPLQPTNPVFDVADCVDVDAFHDEERVVENSEYRVIDNGEIRIVAVGVALPAGTIVAPVLSVVEDYDALLNHAIMGNGRVQETAVNYSTAGYGLKSDRLGWPVEAGYGRVVGMRTIVRRVVDTVGSDVRRIAGFELDTLVDVAALPILAGIDTGQGVDVHRVALADDFEAHAVIVGYEHRIQPNRWRATVYTRTIEEIS